MTTAADSHDRGPDAIIRHCLLLGAGQHHHRRPVKIRLEERLGPELTRRLVSSLTATGRRY